MKLITLSGVRKIVFGNAHIALNCTALACQALHVVLQVGNRLATKEGYGHEIMGNCTYIRVYTYIYTFSCICR